MRVMAVLKDVPSNTHLTAEIYASGRAAFSATALDERHGPPLATNDLTYVKLRPGVSPHALDARLVQFADRRFPEPGGAKSRFRYRLLPLSDVHFADAGLGPSAILRPSADRKVVAGIGGVGLLVVLIAAMNFVALTNARGARRAVEVGVRKVAGARRRDLVVQFIGEALLQVSVAMVIAVALADLSIGPLDAFLHKPMRFDYLRDPGLALSIVGGALVTALLAGLYPALALSAFRPISALKGGPVLPGGAAPVQKALVIGQFAILIGLIVMTGTVYRQTLFALSDALRMDVNQVAWMSGPCRSAFQQEVAALPGVKTVACASRNAFEMGMTPTSVVMPDHSIRTANQSAVDTGFFELQGIRPLAGRLFSRSHGEDTVLEKAAAGSDIQPTIVLNEAAARALGYKSAADAVGASVDWERLSGGVGGQNPPARRSRVIGVIPDFTFASIRTRTPPSIYYVDPAGSSLLVFKLDGRAIPETLAAIKRLWSATGHDRPPGYVFESQDIQDLYGDVVIQGVVVAICSGLAISIACLGLFSLAAFTTERRTKEIGVRKALGARTVDIVRLLLWQFTRPVLWANLIAWPAAFWAMNRWLDGFVYRVDLPPWLFLAASAAALVVAWATVSVHTFIVARAKPVTALRYE
jgi:putative ABC transport system permease protein